jgi:hypothetical protein
MSAALDDLHAAVSATDAYVADLEAQVVDLAARVASQAQEIADLEAQIAAHPPMRVGVYDPQGEPDLEAAEQRAGVAVGTFAASWFFFPSISGATPLAVSRQVAPMLTAGRDVIVNLSTSGVTWRDVADGKQDTPIKAFFAALDGLPNWRRFCFNNEPDLQAWHAPNFERGTPQDYDAACRHLRDLLPPHVDMVFCVAVASRYPQWCLSPWLYGGFSIDGYNRSTSSWLLPTQIVARDLPYVPKTNAPVILTTGSIADAADVHRRAAWVADLANVELGEVIYWMSGDATGGFALSTDEEFLALGKVAS